MRMISFEKGIYFLSFVGWQRAKVLGLPPPDYLLFSFKKVKSDLLKLPYPF